MNNLLNWNRTRPERPLMGIDGTIAYPVYSYSDGYGYRHVCLGSTGKTYLLITGNPFRVETHRDALDLNVWAKLPGPEEVSKAWELPDNTGVPFALHLEVITKMVGFVTCQPGRGYLDEVLFEYKAAFENGYLPIFLKRLGHMILISGNAAKSLYGEIPEGEK